MNYFNYWTLLDHVIKTNNTPLDKRDMIGSAMKYADLSPNWVTVIRELNIQPLELKYDTKFTFEVSDTKGVIKYAPNDRGLYTADNMVKLLETMLYKSLKRNVPIKEGIIKSKFIDAGDHPIITFLALRDAVREGKEIQTAMRTSWIPINPDDDDEDTKYFPSHNLIIKAV